MFYFLYIIRSNKFHKIQNEEILVEHFSVDQVKLIVYRFVFSNNLYPVNLQKRHIPTKIPMIGSN